MHLSIEEQFHKLAAKLRGHYGYYGITENIQCLQNFREKVRWIWRRHLSRRDRGKSMTWSELSRLEERFRLPAAVWSTVSMAGAAK